MTKTLHPAINQKDIGSVPGKNFEYYIHTYEFDWDTLVNFKDGEVFQTPFTVEHSCPGWCIITESREVAEFVADTFDTSYDDLV
tara:strand:- start:55 stop:306 length:252 start_codon:yes stop_codon:yes gene_type:complete